MTLESGLSELSALEKLECLGVGYIDQRIGVAELEWMSSAWPNLQQVSGLFEGFTNDPLLGVCEWLRDNRLGWVPQDEQERFGQVLFKMSVHSVRWYGWVAFKTVAGTLKLMHALTQFDNK